MAYRIINIIPQNQITTKYSIPLNKVKLSTFGFPIDIAGAKTDVEKSVGMILAPYWSPSTVLDTYPPLVIWRDGQTTAWDGLASKDQWDSTNKILQPGLETDDNRKYFALVSYIDNNNNNKIRYLVLHVNGSNNLVCADPEIPIDSGSNLKTLHTSVSSIAGAFVLYAGDGTPYLSVVVPGGQIYTYPINKTTDDNPVDPDYEDSYCSWGTSDNFHPYLAFQTDPDRFTTLTPYKDAESYIDPAKIRLMYTEYEIGQYGGEGCYVYLHASACQLIDHAFVKSGGTIIGERLYNILKVNGASHYALVSSNSILYPLMSNNGIDGVAEVRIEGWDATLGTYYPTVYIYYYNTITFQIPAHTKRLRFIGKDIYQIPSGEYESVGEGVINFTINDKNWINYGYWERNEFIFTTTLSTDASASLSVNRPIIAPELYRIEAHVDISPTITSEVYSL